MHPKTTQTIGAADSIHGSTKKKSLLTTKDTSRYAPTVSETQEEMKIVIIKISV
jgi:hypothetical protein